MRALLLAGLLLAQNAAVDPALVQRYIDGDASTRTQIAGSLTDQTMTAFYNAVMNTASGFSKQSRPKDAAHALEAAVELAATFKAVHEELDALNSLGAIFGQAGDYATSSRYLNAALEKARPGADDDLIATITNNLGNVYRRRGQYDQALAAYSRALALNEAAGRDELRARVLNNMGVLSQEQGDFRQALDYYLQSLSIKERTGPPEEVISTLGNVGSVYALQGNGPQAIEYLERALQSAENQNNVRLMISINANLGRVLLNADRYPESETRLTRALALGEKAAPPDQHAGILTALANLEIKRQQWAAATDHLTQAQALFEKLGDPSNIGQVQLSRAAMAVEHGSAEEGIALARQARDTFARVGRSTALLDADTLLGEAFTVLKRWPDAIDAYGHAIDTVEHGLDLVAGDTESRFRYLERSAGAYFSLAHAYASADRPADALTAAERGRARTLLDMLASGTGDDDLTAEERERRIELDTELNLLNGRIAAERTRLKSGDALDPWLTDARERLRRARDEFALSLDAKHPRLAFARGRAPVLSAKEIAATLPAGSGLIEFVSGSRGSWIMLLVPRPDGEPRLIVKPTALSGAKLSALVDTFVRQVSTRDLAFKPTARALYDALLGPIDSELRALDRIVVVPHRGLWQVPFQALQTPRQKYLVEEHAVSYVPSASALKSLEARQRPRAAASRVVAFGGPTLADPAISKLPNAAREAREVAAIYGSQAVVATEADASEAQFRKLAPGASIVHIATHGTFDNTSPLFSYVRLAGGGSESSSDGRLEGRELINMQLNAELIVLSACETARGTIANGEGVVGLSWALFAAGASTAAVSLWPVDSASTTALMADFHRQRRALTQRSSAAPSARALRTAQLKLLAQPESSHPFYWAGFVVVGVP